MKDVTKNITRLHIAAWCHGIVLVLSVILVAYISIDTFRGWRISSDMEYLSFQLFVCTVFILDFFVELWISRDRGKFLVNNLLFLLVSIPYLNILYALDIPVSHDVFYYLRFMPLLRGAYVLLRSVGYMSNIRIVNIFRTYIALMGLTLYFGALMFFWREHAVNPGVLTFRDSMYFCASQMTTLGCDIFPVTGSGRLISSVLSILGMAMFPLFTVYLVSLVIRFFKREQKAREEATETLPKENQPVS